MNKTIRVKTDAFLRQSLESLSRFSGKTRVEDVFGDALILTATALQKHADGFVIQIIKQSISQDSFGFPFVPAHIYQDMKRRPTSPARNDIFLCLSTESIQALDKICQLLEITDRQDALYYSMDFALLIATGLNGSPVRARLAYVDQIDRHYGTVAQTPYDRGLRNHFNRLFDQIQEKWKYGKNSGPDLCPNSKSGDNTPPSYPDLSA